MSSSIVLRIGICLTVVSATASAQSGIIVRDVGPPTSISTHRFGSILGVRMLLDGSVLVNDGLRRQLIILSADLSSHKVLLDSVSVNGSAYGPRASPLIAYRDDSTLFVDGASSSLTVIDPLGKIVRTMAAPQTRDVRYLASSQSASDAHGNLIYRIGVLTEQRAPLKQGEPTVIMVQDSAPIVRANVETRLVDTLARVKINNGSRTESIRDEQGVTISSKFILNPVAVIDDWTVTSDGSIAILRGHDYHVDWIRSDNTRVSTPKMAYEWKHLSDDDKRALVDSARMAQEKQLDDAMAALKVNQQSSVAGPAPRPPVRPQVTFVPLNQMSDYRPAIRAGALKADADGNLWILPTTSATSNQGELVYDRVNRDGGLFERVRLPLGRSVAGFGRDRTVYLMTRAADGWILERTAVRR